MTSGIRKMSLEVGKKLIKSQTITYMPRYYDVGMNVTDEMFQGRYRDKYHHEDDIQEVLYKAKLFNVDKMLLTGSTLSESRRTMEVAQRFNSLNEESKRKGEEEVYPTLFSTVGVHPCSVMEFLKEGVTVEGHLDELRKLVQYGLDNGIVRAFGEIGLDFDRLYHTPKEQQVALFETQLKLACEFELPLFLHMRSAFEEFVEVLMPFINGTRSDKLELKNRQVLIHSFTGSLKELEYFVEQDGFYISVNGCSLRAEENLEVVDKIPLDRLMIETDSPWCEVKRTHASYKFITQSPNYFYPFEYNTIATNTSTGKKKGGGLTFNEFLPLPVVKSDRLEKYYGEYDQDRANLPPLIKSRNEPSLIGFNAEIMSKLMDVEPQELIDRCYENSEKLFG